MFAVIRTGGKQYKVEAGTILEVEKLPGEAGSELKFDEILLHGEGSSVEVGKPLVAGKTVTAEILEQKRGPKLVAFKKIRRQGKQRKVGHRQDLTRIKIKSV